MIYIKDVRIPELEITQIASDNNISPKLLRVTPYIGESDVPRKVMELELYPTILDDLPRIEWKKYEVNILEKLDQLHKLEIIHGDISEENIVLNLETKEVRLIDFGLSHHVKDILVSDLDMIYEYRKIDVETIEDLYERERIEVCWLCDN